MVPSNKLHKVTLDWITPDAERIVARHARVSTKDPDRGEAEKLLTYCIKHGHWSVFEQVCASFEIITTRAISPQILRHRSFTFQETSQRYCDPLDVLEAVTPECPKFDLREQDRKNRQNSFSFEGTEIEDRFRDRIISLFNTSQDLYRDMLEAGVAKECARNALLICSPTKLHMMGTLRSWLFYVGLRSAPGTQAEHRWISNAIGNALHRELPLIVGAVSSLGYDNPSLLGWKFINAA